MAAGGYQKLTGPISATNIKVMSGYHKILRGTFNAQIENTLPAGQKETGKHKTFLSLLTF
jgi:hypothetical protein